MSLHVIEPGPCLLVVDLGRPSHRSLGVPLGGAADRGALRQGNALVGNAPATPALEFALAGPVLRADEDLGCVVFGAQFDIFVDERAIPVGTTFTLSAGATLRIATTSAGMRGYLCVQGGLNGPAVLGSRSSLEPLKKGDTLTCRPGQIPGRSLIDPVISYTPADVVAIVRCLPGPQADWFDSSQFFGPLFMALPAGNRMGLRLAGTPLSRPARELVSEPIAPGSVQVVNDGQCIVLGVDGQTIGGYPKVAVTITGDLDLLAQLRTGQRVRFVQVTMAEAEAAIAQRRRQISAILSRLSVAQ